MAKDPVHTGQRWVERVFEQIKQEYQAYITVVDWEWYVVGNAYLLCFQLQDTDRRHWIPCEQRGFVKAYIECAGDPNPVNDELREYIEVCIRRKYESLVQQVLSHAMTA